MKTTFSAAVLCAAVAVCLAWSSPPAFAKNAKECSTEWNTIKGTPQASGKTRKAFIADCRGLPDADKPLAQGQFKTEAEAKLRARATASFGST